MKPILFNTEMVRAILDGQKTVTRRAINDKGFTNRLDIETDGSVICYIDQESGESYDPVRFCKYQKGDILYVRETWGYDKNNWLYKADYTEEYAAEPGNLFRWHPSIHMPKKAARIFLRVINVSIERMMDAFDEEKYPHGPENTIYREGFRYGADYLAFWENYRKKLYGKQTDEEKKQFQSYNPWVWVVEFEPEARNE